jgi:hypothetical protein
LILSAPVKSGEAFGMWRTILGALLGVAIGAGLGFATYRFYVGSFDIALMPTKGNIYSTELMVHLALLVGGATGGIVGAIAGATHAVLIALDRFNASAEVTAFAPRQRL